ncbi:hypothetical protein ACFQ8E_04235 [Isoptericola sp. NPDC056573]|uniref:hypothetical protein n=1 Tax=Isoptericola sp. NPDC056573 TaxID=3345868 RepID=UPI00367C9266
MVAGTGLLLVGLVAGAAALALASAAPRTLVLLGDVVLSRRPALWVALPLSAAVAAAGWVVRRRRTRPGAAERGVLVGLLLTPVLGALLAPFAFVAVLAVAGVQRAVAASPSAQVALLLLGAVAVSAHRGSTRGRSERLRRACARLTSGLAAVVTVVALVSVVAAGVLAEATDVVVRPSAGCVVLLHEEQFFFAGSLTVFTGQGGDGPLLVRAGAQFPLEENFPVRAGEYAVEASSTAVRIRFDDGLGGVDSAVPCA